MIISPVLFQVGSGLVESISQIAVIAGTVVLLLLLVAFGGVAYKSLRGDGIRWPEDVDDANPADDGEVQRADNDDEWKYY